MNKILPIQFGNAISQALVYRQAGMSEIEAAVQACKTYNVPVEWALPLQLCLESSISLSESWAQKMLNDSLDRAYSRVND